jgi:diguanylate cyclase (GGDEF)-like protein
VPPSWKATLGEEAVFAKVARVESSHAAMPAPRVAVRARKQLQISRYRGFMQRTSLTSATRVLDSKVSRLAIESGLLLSSEDSPLNLSEEENGAFDQLFRTRLSKANQELAILVREVHAKFDAVLGSTPRRQPISELLMRAVECAVKQQMLREEVSNLALTDELTGVYNRRGFLALAERQLKLGRRADREMLLFFIDVDGLKRINDSFGHSEGDLALIRTMEVMEKTFRDSDVLARIGGDEFAALAIEAPGHSEATIKDRLLQNLATVSRKEPRYQLSFSLGAVRFDPRTGSSIAQLMCQADQAMYEHKTQQRKSSRADALFPGLTSGTLRVDLE